MTRETVAVAVALGLLVGSYGLGVSHERSRWQGRIETLQARYDTATALSVQRAREVTQAEAARAALARQLEEQGDADEDAGRVSLPAHAVGRLQQRGAR